MCDYRLTTPGSGVAALVSQSQQFQAVPTAGCPGVAASAYTWNIDRASGVVYSDESIATAGGSFFLGLFGNSFLFLYFVLFPNVSKQFY